MSHYGIEIFSNNDHFSEETIQRNGNISNKKELASQILGNSEDFDFFLSVRRG